MIFFLGKLEYNNGLDTVFIMGRDLDLRKNHLIQSRDHLFVDTLHPQRLIEIQMSEAGLEDQ